MKNKATSGFIYLWYDRKHKRFYLGKHWGTLDDGYVCSSKWMKQAYEKRPQDFKRRILEWVYTNRVELGEAEYRWGSLIKEEELGKRYYNIKIPKDHHWHDDPKQRREVGKKIAEVHRGNKYRLGKTHTEETRSKISKTKKGVKNVNFTEESRKKASQRITNWNIANPQMPEHPCKLCGKLFNAGNLKKHVCRSVTINYIEAALLG